MTEWADGTVSPGWYATQATSGRERYWDGTAWKAKDRWRRGTTPEFPTGSLADDAVPPNDAVLPNRVTTLQGLPGFRVVEVLGVVSEVAASSGWTATSKGSSAVNDGMSQLRQSAFRMGASAIVGLVCSVFGAAGGLTGGLGGDAVGVLLMGTAVIVEAEGEQLVRAVGQ